MKRDFKSLLLIIIIVANTTIINSIFAMENKKKHKKLNSTFSSSSILLGEEESGEPGEESLGSLPNPSDDVTQFGFHENGGSLSMMSLQPHAAIFGSSSSSSSSSSTTTADDDDENLSIAEKITHQAKAFPQQQEAIAKFIATLEEEIRNTLIHQNTTTTTTTTTTTVARTLSQEENEKIKRFVQFVHLFLLKSTKYFQENHPDLYDNTNANLYTTTDPQDPSVLTLSKSSISARANEQIPLEELKFDLIANLSNNLLQKYTIIFLNHFYPNSTDRSIWQQENVFEFILRPIIELLISKKSIDDLWERFRSTTSQRSWWFMIIPIFYGEGVYFPPHHIPPLRFNNDFLITITTGEAFICAARKGDIKTIKELLSQVITSRYGTNIIILNKALVEAARGGYGDNQTLIQILNAIGLITNIYNTAVIYEALTAAVTEEGNADTVEQLLKMLDPRTKQGEAIIRQAFIAAAKNKKIKIAQAILTTIDPEIIVNILLTINPKTEGVNPETVLIDTLREAVNTSDLDSKRFKLLKEVFLMFLDKTYSDNKLKKEKINEAFIYMNQMVGDSSRPVQILPKALNH